MTRLGDIAHLRCGDKGDTSNVTVIPYDGGDYDWLKAYLTPERVHELYGPLVRGEVRRYEVPGIRALNFVMTNALGGGVSRSLNLDIHGKSWAAILARVEVQR